VDETPSNRDFSQCPSTMLSAVPMATPISVNRSPSLSTRVKIRSTLHPSAIRIALIVVDEADRLQMNSLEQVRSVFDSGDMGMILIGMPGIEKRIARFPQLYSRIGFVHEFRPLGAAEVQELLERCWTPPGVTLPDSGFSPEVVARLVRMTGGNLRLLTRLLTQVERVLGVNDTEVISVEIVEAARDSLVIGQA
jgi:DNA transposition AAA+ family ATPase